MECVNQELSSMFNFPHNKIVSWFTFSYKEHAGESSSASPLFIVYGQLTQLPLPDTLLTKVSAAKVQDYMYVGL